MGGADLVGIAAHAAGDDHPAVFGKCLADRLERLALGKVEEAAGVDDDSIRTLVIGGKAVSFGRQPAQDAFAVDECLGAAEADNSDGRDTRGHGGGEMDALFPRVKGLPADPAKAKARP